MEKRKHVENFVADLIAGITHNELIQGRRKELIETYSFKSPSSQIQRTLSSIGKKIRSNKLGVVYPRPLKAIRSRL